MGQKELLKGFMHDSDKITFVHWKDSWKWRMNWNWARRKPGFQSRVNRLPGQTG